MRRFYFLGIGIFMVLFACERQGTTAEYSNLQIDSLRISRGLQLRKEKKYEEALMVLDTLVREGKSTFLFSAMRQMMALYTLSGRREEGEMYFMKRAEEEGVIGEYRREWLIAAAQLAFEADKDSVALRLLEQAERCEEKNIPERLLFFYRIAGGIYMFCDKEKERCIATFQKAVEIVEKYGDTGEMGMQCIGRLASVYRTEGRYDEGIKMCYRILDVGKHSGNTESISRASSELAYFYGVLGEYEKALEWSQQAIRICEGKSEMVSVLADLYRARSNWLNESKRFLEAMECVRLADSCYKVTGNKRARLFTRMNGALYRLNVPDSLERGIEILQSVIQDEQFKALPPRHQYSTWFELGRGLLMAGREKEGLPLVQDAAAWYDRHEDIEMQDYVYSFLTDYYARNGFERELARCFSVYHNVRDTLFKREKVQYMVTANVKFETEKKEQQNRILATELALHKRTIQYYIVFGLVFICLAISLVVWLWMRQRALQLKRTIDKMRIRAQEEELYSLLKSQRALNRKNEELKAEIEGILNNISSQERLQPDITSVLGSLSPRLLTEQEEMKFRKAFNGVYPDFIRMLRNRYPVVSKNEELICMLIYMGSSSEEIAFALGISRESVNKARYRIRKKLNLPKEITLDSWVKEIIN